MQFFQEPQQNIDRRYHRQIWARAFFKKCIIAHGLKTLIIKRKWAHVRMRFFQERQQNPDPPDHRPIWAHTIFSRKTLLYTVNGHISESFFQECQQNTDR